MIDQLTVGHFLLVMMKKILILFFLLGTIGSYGQTISTNLVETRGNYPTDWTIYVDETDFSIEYKFVDCQPKYGYDAQYLILKITNKTASKIALEWNSEVYRDNKCNTCNYPDEYHFSISIAANEVVIGNCDLESDRNLKIFSKFIDPQAKNTSHMTAFKLGNLTQITN